MKVGPNSVAGLVYNTRTRCSLLDIQGTVRPQSNRKDDRGLAGTILVALVRSLLSSSSWPVSLFVWNSCSLVALGRTPTPLNDHRIFGDDRNGTAIVDAEND